MRNLTQRVKAFAKEIGVDLIGIAPEDCFSRLPGVRPDELLPNAKSVIVVAIRHNVYLAQHRPSWHQSEAYVGGMAFGFIVVERISAFLEDEGYEAFPVSGHGIFTPRGTSYRKAIKALSIDEDGQIHGVEEFREIYFREHHYLSFIRLAEEAGLGELGRCSMLVTPRFGPRVRLAAVITDAELEPDGRMKEKVCLRDECSKCVEYCASGAIKPYGYNIVKCMIQMGLLSLELLKRRDYQEIERRLALAAREVFPGGAAGGGCGKCLIACPLGRKYEAKPYEVYGSSTYMDTI